MPLATHRPTDHLLDLALDRFARWRGMDLAGETLTPAELRVAFIAYAKEWCDATGPQTNSPERQ